MAVNITIAKLNTMVTANATQFVTEFNKAENVSRRVATSVRNAMGSLGIGLSVAAMGAFAKSVLDLGGNIIDLSRQADMGAQAFQTLTAVAMESGVPMEQVAKSSETLRNKLQEAFEGSEAVRKSLRALNLTAAGLQQMAPERQWETIAQSIANAADKQEAFNAASDLFGSKNAPKLREVLERLAKEGFDTLAISTGKLRISDEDLASLDKAGDFLSRIALNLKIIASRPLGRIAKGLDALSADGNTAEGAKAKFQYWLDQGNGPLAEGWQQQYARLKAREKPVGVAAGWSVSAMEERNRREQEAINKRDPFYFMREENAQNNKVDSLLKEFFESLDEKSKANKFERRNFAIPELNQDRLARIGLLTGDGAQTELKRQTNFLQEAVNQLKRLNALTERQNSAVFA